MTSSSLKWRRGKTGVLTGVAALTVAAVVATGIAVAHAGTAAPFITGTQTTPVYSYQNAIRESVTVATGVDNDGDGQPDRVVVDLIRPREAATTGVKVPVIMLASPYFQCCGRGPENEKKAYGADGTVTSFPLY